MPESVLLAAYWQPRPLSLDEGAQRLCATLDDLGRCGHPFHAWFEKARSRASALESPVTLTQDALARLLSQGQNRTDMTGEPIPTLGYRLSLWNGEDVEFTAGIGRTSPRVTNSVMVSVGATSSDGALRRSEDAANVLEALVRNWDADWAVALPRSLEDVRPPVVGRPRAGWLTWVKTPAGGRWWSTGESMATATPEAAASIQAELAPYV